MASLKSLMAWLTSPLSLYASPRPLYAICFRPLFGSPYCSRGSHGRLRPLLGTCWRDYYTGRDFWIQSDRSVPICDCKIELAHLVITNPSQIVCDRELTSIQSTGAQNAVAGSDLGCAAVVAANVQIGRSGG